MQLPDGADRDFTASAYVVQDDAVLLVRHAKLGQWLQPGGHIEDREMPHETARRETREETGKSIAIHQDFRPHDSLEESHNLPEPFTINLHRIKDGHWHCDFSFLATVEEDGEATHADEHDGMRWFTAVDLDDDSHDMPEGTRETAKEVLMYVQD
ncbi:MAG: NUDIX domain-containing protein [Candidatus Nanohaloarchaea archaeon]|nr:NUDIX domain-containing protein [Candidatus Nanohaloarchaea archaeon]